MTKTTACAVEAPEALPHGDSLTIAHDGIHWSGTFRRILTAGLGVELEDAPLKITVTAETTANHFQRITGEAVALDEQRITFADGATVDLDHVLSVTY